MILKISLRQVLMKVCFLHWITLVFLQASEPYKSTDFTMKLKMRFYVDVINFLKCPDVLNHDKCRPGFSYSLPVSPLCQLHFPDTHMTHFLSALVCVYCNRGSWNGVDLHTLCFPAVYLGPCPGSCCCQEWLCPASGWRFARRVRGRQRSRGCSVELVLSIVFGSPCLHKVVVFIIKSITKRKRKGGTTSK